MVDTIKVLAATGDDTLAPPVATDDIAGIHYQKVKFGWGADGNWVETADTDGIRIPIGGGQIGATTESPPPQDTGTASGLNGRLQRVAQRLTSLMNLFPASLGTKTAANSMPVTLASDEPQNVLIGAVSEAAPASDTANSGLNGRLKRIAQNLTTLIGLLPTALTPAGALKDGCAEAVLTASVATGVSLQATGTDLAGLRNWGILVPSTFDGTQIQFQMCDTLGGTYVPVYDITNTRVVMTVAVSRYYDVPGELMAIRFLKIETLTAQATTSTDFLIIGKS